MSPASRPARQTRPSQSDLTGVTLPTPMYLNYVSRCRSCSRLADSADNEGGEGERGRGSESEGEGRERTVGRGNGRKDEGEGRRGMEGKRRGERQDEERAEAATGTCFPWSSPPSLLVKWLQIPSWRRGR